MAYPALPSFPASTSTSFDDLMAIKAGDRFVLRGYEYRAEEDAVVWRKFGFENVGIRAVRRHGAMPSGWECADVREHRTYIAPLCELLDENGR